MTDEANIAEAELAKVGELAALLEVLTKSKEMTFNELASGILAAGYRKRSDVLEEE